jgi:hypothetical protein
MRRIFSLATLLLLSLSRFGATAHAHAASTMEHRTRELVATAPSVRLAAITVREQSPRTSFRLLGPWHPSRVDATLSFAGALARAAALPQPTARPAGVAHRLTYDATAPPRLS